MGTWAVRRGHVEFRLLNPCGERGRPTAASAWLTSGLLRRVGLIRTLRGCRGPSDEITLEFGLSLSAEADVVISSTSAQANFAVRLTWDRRAPEDGVPDEPSGAPGGQVRVPTPATPA
ncbi:CU044_2847 family protein [Streptomyces sp. NPDC056921]|uniref:CU044_2847 family protein n=1 Tax=Streptomyces sp. NPDC056921 TaxID=3345966 RepID=UPI00362EE346